MSIDDRPITHGGTPVQVQVRLPRGAKPVSGDFTVSADDPEKPFVKVVFLGPSEIGDIKKQPDGSFEWVIDNNWMITIE
jgi:hypothetical protein